MAYVYTILKKKIPLLMGEHNDRCFFCNRGLQGKDCLREADFLICFENCQGGSD